MTARRLTEWPVLGGCAALAISLLLPWVHFTDTTSIGDIRHYHAIVHRLFGGDLPYRDYFVEYPPGALAAFALPAAVGRTISSYAVTFRALDALVTAVLVVAAVLTTRRLGADRGAGWFAALGVGIFPALLGSVYFERYDVWAAGLTSFALLALLTGRRDTSAVLLGLGVATKVYPVLLLPLFVLHLVGRASKQVALRFASIAALVFAVAVGPFALLAPGGVAYSFKTQLTRVLEIESLAGVVLLCAHQVGAYRPTVHAGLSYELVGRAPDLFGAVQTLLLAAGLVAAWWAYARSARSDGDLVLAAATVVSLTVAFDKVLSPQYLVWIAPLVVLLRGRPAAVASVLLGAAAVLTAVYFPSRFHDLRALGGTAWIVLARDLVLAALAGWLLAWLLRRPAQGPYPRSA